MIDSIQSLRALAAIYVVIFHAARKVGEISIFTEVGRSGVDLFFIISGFVITLSVFKSKNVNAKTFLVRRLIRVVPLYWVLTIFFSLLLYFIPTIFQTYTFDFKHIVTSLLFLPQAVKPVVYTGWTLVYEMYFYLVFTIFLFIFKLKAPLYIIVFFIASYLAGIFIEKPSSPHLIIITSELLLEFIIGIIFCYLYLKDIRVANYISIGLLFLGVFLFIILSDKTRTVAFGIPWAIIFFSVVFSRFRILESRILILLGNASYSIYLIHIFTLPAVHMVISSAGYNIPAHSILLILIYTLTGVISGVICYLLLERPMTYYLKSFVSKNVNNIKTLH